MYRREDVETVFEIKRLLYDEGFTIAGARKHIAESKAGNGREAAGPAQRAAAPARSEAAARAHRKFLLDLREEMVAILTLLERE